MKTSTRTVLLASLLALSPVSYGYGDILFGALLKGVMTDERMVNVAPKQKATPEPDALEVRAAALVGPTVGTCLGASYRMSEDFVPHGSGWAHQDCVPR